MGIKIGDSMVETQTIDVEHVQKILNNCPNYDIIVNSEFPFEDTFSDKLVDWYRELVFSANGNNTLHHNTSPMCAGLAPAPLTVL